MTRLQIEIVQNSFCRIKSQSEFSLTFHRLLFALDPTIRPFFPEDTSEQRANFLMLLKFIVETLDRIYIFTPSLENLGRKVASYGLSEVQYKMIGAAFIMTLRQTFASEATLEIEAAWLKAYELISGTMQGVSNSPKSAIKVAGSYF